MGRIIDIDAGRLLIASDLHGNWEDYQKIKNVFKSLRDKGKADALILDGDLVHGYPGYEDKSVEILDDLIDNPDSRVISMLGNHELMHIYHLGKNVKNVHDFAGPLEKKIEGNRARYVDFMKSMPYAVRTAGGVLINHTGANVPMAADLPVSDYPHHPSEQLSGKTDGFELVDSLDHDAVLAALGVVMEAQSGQRLPDDFSHKYSPQIGQTFNETAIGNYLLEVFFNKNEDQYKDGVYERMLTIFMRKMSKGGSQQRFLVSGHIEVPDGYRVVGGKQLRISSSHGAEDSKKVLASVDASRQYSSVGELVKDLIPVYP